MTFVRSGFLLVLVVCVLAPGIAAQRPANDDIFTISVAAPTAAKDVQVRYFFARDDLRSYGSSVADTIEGNRIVIKTAVEGKSARSFKLVAYAPGCQLVTLSVDDLAANREGEFHCQKLGTLQLRGRLDILDFARQSTHEVPNLQVEALYMCRWVMPFFGIPNGAVSPIAVGKARVASDGAFTIEVPDFTADPSWPTLSGDAGLTFVLEDGTTGTPLGTLSSLSDLSRNDGIVPVASSYPELMFAVKK